MGLWAVSMDGLYILTNRAVTSVSRTVAVAANQTPSYNSSVRREFWNER